jgi:hypothetical protein
MSPCRLEQQRLADTFVRLGLLRKPVNECGIEWRPGRPVPTVASR